MTKGTTWTYSYCETCMKNFHETVKMIREKLASGNPDDKSGEEVWACPKCGSTKML